MKRRHGDEISQLFEKGRTVFMFGRVNIDFLMLPAIEALRQAYIAFAFCLLRALVRAILEHSIVEVVTEW